MKKERKAFELGRKMHAEMEEVPLPQWKLEGETKAAVKFDGEKTRLDLLSVPALLGISDVLTHGAKKYADHNWRSGEGLEWHRLIRAALKHLLAFQAGEDLDAESGLPHIDHLLCTAMFLSEYQKTGLGKDDRWKVKGKFS